MVSRPSLKQAVIGAVALLVVVGGPLGYVGYTYGTSPPKVQSVNSEWGAVTSETTQIETTVVVNNPNSVPLPGIIGLKYTTKLNGVVIMQGKKSSVGMQPGKNTITIPAEMENRAIAEWWVTHVNNGEQSTMTVSASVLGPGGFERQITSRQTTFETNMLDSMSSSEPKTVMLQGEEFIVLKDQSASWGKATMEETPINFEATVVNKHDYALTLDGLGYVIRMNNVTVGSGRTTDGVEVKPGETGTIQVNAAIDTKKMAKWWATHVRNNESTKMRIAMYGLVERDGELVRVPFSLFEQNLRFTTNMLEGGSTQVQPIQSDGGGVPSYQQPKLLSQRRSWASPYGNTSLIRTKATLQNPNNGSLNEFVQLESQQTVTINGVKVVDDTAEIGTLQPGKTTVRTNIEWQNEKTSNWWVKHVNNGEQSTRKLTATTRADLGFTKLDVRSQSGTTRFTTNILEGIETDKTFNLTTADGTKVGEMRKVRAEWGTADSKRSPIKVDVTIKNTFANPLTFTDLKYNILMNNVSVGKGTAPESYTIQPGRTRTVTFTIAIDSQKMDAWWPTHLENGERTRADIKATVLVKSGISSERVSVDALTSSQNVTTDFLGQGEN